MTDYAFRLQTSYSQLITYLSRSKARILLDLLNSVSEITYAWILMQRSSIGLLNRLGRICYHTRGRSALVSAERMTLG